MMKVFRFEDGTWSFRIFGRWTVDIRLPKVRVSR